MKKLYFVIVFFCLSVAAVAAEKTYIVSSPDGNISVEVYTGESLAYSMLHKGDVMLAKTPVSMTLEGGVVYGGADKVRKAVRKSVDRTIPAVIYKKASVRDRYNEMTLVFKGYSVVFRVFDDGMAYRFRSDSKVPFKVVSEQAGFVFPEDWNIYVPYVRHHLDTFETQLMTSFENSYAYVPLSGWNKERLAFLPVMVEASKGRKLNIMEADLLNYPGMFLYNGDADRKLESVFARYPKTVEQGGHNRLQGLVREREEFIATCEGATDFPWRIISLSERDADMADNDMVYRLAKDPAGTDWSWVRPGKVAWEWWNDWNLRGVDFRTGVNNDTYKYYIDFAAEKGVEYVILDEGWAVNKKADLFQIVPEINLEELVAHAEAKGVGIILWAGYWAFDKDLEKVCEHYSKMGVKGFKVDFMDRDDQMMVDFHRRAAEVAAKWHLMIDFHGTYKPTGLQRTYPNVVNFEGVYGLENMKWVKRDADQVEYDVTIPFVRMACGPMDYTQGAMKNAVRKNYHPAYSEPMSQGTRCHQLAEYVVFEAPLTMLCDSPSNYLEEEECTRFIVDIPTVWDETRALDGKVADYVVMARRRGDAWYVGGLTDWNAREIDVDLGFLPEGNYTVELFKDGVNADRAGEDYRREILDVAAGKVLKLWLAPGGGFAMKITNK